MKEKDFNKLISILFLCISMAIYLFFGFYDGAFLFNDSESYITMSFAREPVYCMVLAFFRFLNEENYLILTVIFQSILAAFAGWKLADYIRCRLQIHWLYSAVLYVIPIFASLLNRFFAGRAAMYSNSIQSEGIAISLYLLFVLYVLKYCFEKSGKALVIASIISLVLISTRKQMIVTLALLICVVLWQGLCQKQMKKALVRTLICVVSVLCLVRVLDCTYNYVLRGSFVSHSSDNRFLSTMVFYNAEEKDADYIEDEKIRNLFLNIYHICDEKGYIAEHAGEGWLNEVSHFGQHYDHVQIDTMWPMIRQYAADTLGDVEQTLYDKETDRVTSIIIKSIAPHQITKLIKCVVNNFLEGLITSIAQMNKIFMVCAVVIYAVYMVLLVKLLLALRMAKREMVEAVLRPTLEFAGFTILAIIINVGLVSLVIFCQARYTIYNMPLFYMSGAVLLYYNALLVWNRVRNNKK